MSEELTILRLRKSDYVDVPDLPDYISWSEMGCNDSVHKGICLGEFRTKVLAIDEKVTFWRKNMFAVPNGNTGK